MEKIVKFSLISSILISSSANAAFTQAYELSNWTQITQGGLIDISGAPDTVVLTSSNDESGDEKNQDFIITAPYNADISFSWHFQTTDTNDYDPFGLLLNGVFTQLSDNLANNDQSGVFSFQVVSGDLLGFRANSIDSLSGASMTEISNFNAVPTNVPIPATFWLMGCALITFFQKSRWAHYGRR